MQTEMQDVVGTDPENKTGVVGTSAITIGRADGKDCTCVSISNPFLGSRGNDFGDVIYVSIDGSDPIANGETVMVGNSIVLSGNIPDGNIKIASNNAGTNYEAILFG